MALIFVFVFVLLIFSAGGFWAGAKWMKRDLKKRGKIRKRYKENDEE